MRLFFIVIVLFLVALSFSMSKKLKNGKDFLVPSDGLPFVIVAFSMAASQFGSSFLIGGVQQSQQQAPGQGFWPAIYTLLAASLSCFINILVAPRFRTFGDSVTPPDFIEIRYGRSSFMRGYHAAAYICSITAVLASQFIGFAGMGVVAGFSYRFSIILCAVIVCLLALGSGMTGVAWANMLQYSVIVVLLLLSMDCSLGRLNAAEISFQDVFGEPFFPTPALRDKFYYTAFPMLIGNLFNYEYFMRFMSCKGIAEARKASALAGLLLLITAIPIALLGSVANYFYRDAASTSVFGLMTGDMAPWMSMLMVIAVLFTVLTSADSILTSASGMLARDIYGSLMNKKKPLSEIRNFKEAVKVSMVLVAFVAANIALFYDQILRVSFYFSPFTSGTMFAPMIIGLFWKKASRKGAISAVICSAVAALLHVTGVITLFDRVAGPALIGTIVIVAVSLLCPDQPLEKPVNK